MDHDSKFCPVFLFEIYFSIRWKDGFINRYDVSNNLLLFSEGPGWDLGGTLKSNKESIN